MNIGTKANEIGAPPSSVPRTAVFSSLGAGHALEHVLLRDRAEGEVMKAAAKAATRRARPLGRN
jgi:hypothetical protein